MIPVANKVEIIVVAKDNTGAVFNDVERKAKASGEKAGKAAGDGIADGIQKSIKATSVGNLPGFEEGGRKAGAGFGNGFLGQVTGIAQKAGSALASGIGEALSTGSGPLVVGLVSGLIAGAVVASPLIAAAIAGAISAGGLVSATVAGLIIAGMSDPRIAAAGEAVWKSVFGRLQDASGVFYEPIMESLRILEAGFDNVESKVQNIFANSAEYVAPLTEAFVDFVDSAVTGLDTLIEKTGGEAAQGLGLGIRQLGESVEEVLNTFSEVPEAGEAVAAVLILIGEVAETVAVSIAALSTLWEGFTDKIRAVNEALDPQEGKFIELGEDLDDLAGSFGSIAEEAESAAAAMSSFYEETLKQSDPLLAWADAQRDLEEATKASEDALKKHGASSDEYNAALEKQYEATLKAGQAAGTAADSFNGKFTPAQYAAIAALGLEHDEIMAIEERLRELKKGADNVKGNYELNVKAVGITQAVSGLMGVKDAVNSIPGSKTVYVNVVATGAVGLATRRSGGPIGAAATGGVRGNDVLVGEEGPEIVRLPYGSTVLPNGQTRRVFADEAKKADEERQAAPMDNREILQALRELGDRIEGMTIKFDGRVLGAIQGRDADLLYRAG